LPNTSSASGFRFVAVRSQQPLRFFAISLWVRPGLGRINHTEESPLFIDTE
jgi:hypothetical protein